MTFILSKLNLYTLHMCCIHSVSLLYFIFSSGMNAQYMNQAAAAPYPPQTGMAVDISTYHHSSMPPVSYPVAAPPHPAPQQQQALYYQQPLL